MVTCLTHEDGVGGRGGWNLNARVGGGGVGGEKRLEKGRFQICTKI